MNFNSLFDILCKIIERITMNKLLLAGILSVSIYAADHDLYNNSVQLVGGYTVNTEDSDIDKDMNFGFRYNYNRNTDEGTIDIDAIQFAYDYSNSNAYDNILKRVIDGETSIHRFGANAVWYLENDSDITPFALVGAGVQIFGEEPVEDSNNMFFGTMGAGAEYQLRGDFSVVAEGKAMFAGDDAAYLTGNVGVKYSFGQNYVSHADDVIFGSNPDGDEADEAR